MRIIGGTRKSTRLIRPRPKEIRPTMDRVKEAYFNIVAHQIPGSYFLDAYAGSGSIGLEALSRGSEVAVFLESHPQALKTIQKNIERTGLTEGAIIIPGDVVQAIPKKLSRKSFQLMYLDPPYRVAVKPVLEQIIKCGILATDGLITLERSKEEQCEDHPGLELVLKRLYGDVQLLFYQKRR